MIDDPKPLPPEILADALQDKIHEDKGRMRAAKSTRQHPHSDLLPCPFCGRSLEYDNDLGISYHPKTPNNGYCPAGAFWINRRDMAGMKEIWNTRHE